jgi:mitotic spindle assembly checkpoint protein MAD2B
MSAAPPPRPPILNTSLSLTRTLTDFLTITLHTILSIRSLYPPSSFLTTRAYNLPVSQSRHPSVCTWITTSIAHLQPLLLSSSLSCITFVIFSSSGQVLERYLFDVSRFPVDIGEKEKWTEFEEGRGMQFVDIEEQLRATLKKLQIAGGRLSLLPEGCTFTLVVEMREGKEAPIGHPMPWIASEPGLQTRMGDLELGKGKETAVGRDLGGVKSTPVRLVEAGDFVLETWIEEGRAKFEVDEDEG